MIESIQEQALKIFNRHEILKNDIEGRGLFPLTISLKRISGRELISDFGHYRGQFTQLHEFCLKHRLDLKYDSVKNRQIGTQRVPTEVVFPNQDIFLSFLGKHEQYKHWIQTASLVVGRIPVLKGLILKSPQKITDHARAWPALLDVLETLGQGLRSQHHVRLLEIPGVDTKFIEGHKRVLLDAALWIEAQGCEEILPRISVEDFENYFGFSKEAPRLRFRILDGQMDSLFGGLRDIEAPSAQISELNLSCERVFVVENKVPGLFFPDIKDSLVFFELGYKANILKDISWLKNKKIIYWGDVDTHGFAILSQLRRHLPQVESILMNTDTFLNHSTLWSLEGQPYLGECENLTLDERTVFEGLRTGKWGHNLRLEQERIPLETLSQHIQC